MHPNPDIYLNKKQTVERCLDRISAHYDGTVSSLSDLDHQDVIILNLQRACQAISDYGNHLIAVHQLPVPQSGKDTYKILEQAGNISPELSQTLQAMVGFRNLAVHQYQDLDLDILKAILDNYLSSLLEIF